MQPINAPATPIKPTLIYLRDRHHFDITTLARQALVHLEIVYRMLLGDPVARDCAVMVLKTFSEYAGSTYTLKNVDVRVLHE